MKDWILERDSEVARRRMVLGLTPVVSTTKRPFFVYALPCNAVITSLAAFCSVIAGTVTVDGWLTPSSTVGKPLVSAALGIDSNAAKFLTGAFTYQRAGGVFFKAAATAHTFSAADTIGASNFGIWLVQITDAGVVSTKPGSATMTYTTAKLALAALPAPDASNTAIGYIAVAAAVGGFTANTTALTGIATYVDYVEATTRLFTATITPVAGTSVLGTISTTFANAYGKKGDLLVLACTADGSGALTDGRVTLGWRPYPLKGEAGR